MIALASVTATLVPVIPTAPAKLLAASSSVTSKPLAEIVVVPPMVKVPLSITAPPAVTERFAEVVRAPKSNAPLSLIVTLASVPPEANATVPVNVLALSKIISVPVAVAVKVELPVIATTPLSLILPVVAVAVKLPPTVVAPKFSVLASVTVTLPDPVPVIARVPTSISSPCAPPELPMAAPEVNVRVPVVAIAVPVSSSSSMVLLETKVRFLAPRVSSSRVIAPDVMVEAPVPAPSDPAVVACPIVSVPVVAILSSSVSDNSVLVAVPKAKVPATDCPMVTLLLPAVMFPTKPKSAPMSVTAPPAVIVWPAAILIAPVPSAAPELL